MNTAARVAAAILAAGIVLSGSAACSAGEDRAPTPSSAGAVPAPSGPGPGTVAPPAPSRPATPPITDVAQLDPVCPLLDGEQVGTLFGGAPATGVEGSAQHLDNGAVARQCTYLVGTAAVAVLTVSVGRGSTVGPQEMIAAVRQQAGNGEPVDGMGAAAVFATHDAVGVLSAADTVGGVPVLVSLSGAVTTPQAIYRSVLARLAARL